MILCPSRHGRFLKPLILLASFLLPNVAYSFTLHQPRLSTLPFPSHTKHTKPRLQRLQLQSTNATSTYYASAAEDVYSVTEPSDFLNQQLVEFKSPSDESILLSLNSPLPSHPQVKKNLPFTAAARARLLLLGAAALYGTNFALVKMLDDTIPVGINSSLRFALAALCTSPFLLKDIRKKGSLNAAWLGFEVGLLNSIGYVAQAVGLETTPASESAFICSLAVVVVSLLDFLSGKKIFSRQWVGIVLAVLGVAFLELKPDLSFQAITSGDVLSLVQPFAFGLGFWRMEKAMQRHPDQASRMTAAQLLAVCFASVVYALITINHDTMISLPWSEWSSDPHLIAGLLWTGIVTTALSIYMENLALETLSATETTLIFTTEPLWGTAFSVMVMGEQFGLNSAVGAALIITACVYSNLGLDGLLAIGRKRHNTIPQQVINEDEMLPIDDYVSINACK